MRNRHAYTIDHDETAPRARGDYAASRKGFDRRQERQARIAEKQAAFVAMMMEGFDHARQR